MRTNRIICCLFIKICFIFTNQAIVISANGIMKIIKCHLVLIGTHCFVICFFNLIFIYINRTFLHRRMNFHINSFGFPINNNGRIFKKPGVIISFQQIVALQVSNKRILLLAIIIKCQDWHSQRKAQTIFFLTLYRVAPPQLNKLSSFHLHKLVQLSFQQIVGNFTPLLYICH